MKESAVRGFLAQFEASQDNFKSWPSWMRESATVAVASLPRVVSDRKALPSTVQPTIKDEKRKP
jgi:hypothetical protein